MDDGIDESISVGCNRICMKSAVGSIIVNIYLHSRPLNENNGNYCNTGSTGNLLSSFIRRGIFYKI